MSRWSVPWYCSLSKFLICRKQDPCDQHNIFAAMCELDSRNCPQLHWPSLELSYLGWELVSGIPYLIVHIWTTLQLSLEREKRHTDDFHIQDLPTEVHSWYMIPLKQHTIVPTCHIVSFLYAEAPWNILQETTEINNHQDSSFN